MNSPSIQARRISRTEAGMASPDWELPICPSARTVPRFPVEALPDWVRDFVHDVSSSFQTPTDLAGSLALALLSVPPARRIQVRRTVREAGGSGQDHVEHVNLFVAVVLRPGTRKSPVFKRMLGPIYDYQKSRREREEPRRRRLLAEKEILERQCLDAKKQASKSGDQADIERAVELSERLAELEDVGAPYALVIDDSTAEKVALHLRQQGERALVASTEGGIFATLGGRYSDGIANLDVFLKGKDGDPLRVDRISRHSFELAAPIICAALTIQPDVLRSLNGNRVFRSRGFLARWLFALPDDGLGSRKVRGKPSIRREIEQRYRDLTERLFIRFDRHEELSREETAYLHLTQAALDLIDDFDEEIEPRLGLEGDLASMTDFAGKCIGGTLRIAAVLSIADRIESQEPDALLEPIGKDAMSRAITLARYYLAHAQAACSLIGIDPDEEGADRIIGWLRRRITGGEHFEQGVTQREIHRALRGTLATIDDLQRPLELVVEYGFLAESPPSSGGVGRPSKYFQVNPLWIESVSSEHDGQNGQNGQEDVRNGDSVHFVHAEQDREGPETPQSLGDEAERGPIAVGDPKERLMAGNSAESDSEVPESPTEQRQAEGSPAEELEDIRATSEPPESSNDFGIRKTGARRAELR